jgi:hypothetical protein
MPGLRKIKGYYCRNCNFTVFSRAQHDFRGCYCWRKNPVEKGVAVDGGTLYSRILTGQDFIGEPVEIETEMEDWQFYDDWNLRTDKWGIHSGKIERLKQ